MLISARTADEYLLMFDLSSAYLMGKRVLDCPGGAAAFVAFLAEVGVDATAVDPAYRLGDADLRSYAEAETRRGSAFVRAHSERYVWEYFADEDAHEAQRLEAVGKFAAHRRSEPWRYVEGVLPKLPFDDTTFDVAVSSHLLFAYDDRLNADFHVAAACEMMRVAYEIRIFPTVTRTGHESPLVPAVAHALENTGARVERRTSRYRFQRGAQTILVARR